jgi:hypothetical protein
MATHPETDRRVAVVSAAADRLLELPAPPPSASRAEAVLALAKEAVIGEVIDIDVAVGGGSDELSCAYVLIAELVYRQLANEGETKQ